MAHDKETDKSVSTQPPRRVTLVDVAKKVGVSTSTVSLVLRDSPTIPERTRKRVLEAADQLGYVYNRRAAGLRSAQSGIVGVVVNDLTNPYFAEIVASIQESMTMHGRVVVLSNTAESTERQKKFVDTMREYNVDGIVICPAENTTPDLIQKIQAWRKPCILFSRNIPSIEADYVAGDNRGGMYKVTQHLIELGHRRIAMIGVNDRTSTGRDRRDGYLDGLANAGISVEKELMVTCPATRADGMEAISNVLDKENPPTAAVCFNDIVAFGVMLGLRARQLEPGRDFSVTGFDDIAESRLWRPALTSVAISRSQIGDEVVSLLLRRLREPDSPYEHSSINTELVVRDSTSALTTN
ncbi:LacI family DNA-binding transcriptional regulator [Litchfieldella xinjiangensis]|uniref:LacI family DNA-binding transcriptional regulator n=1 Tax=Litchfieldella xinjiangensis TaxID=1166948 RepID=UPI0009DD9B5A|nr:LacI family DNA-binding transcriptional regulator [Halomonas xinjiangensis]